MGLLQTHSQSVKLIQFFALQSCHGPRALVAFTAAFSVDVYVQIKAPASYNVPGLQEEHFGAPFCFCPYMSFGSWPQTQEEHKPPFPHFTLCLWIYKKTIVCVPMVCLQIENK